MNLIPLVKGNGINKKPINNCIKFQVIISKWRIVNVLKSLRLIDSSIVNSLDSHEFSREHFWVFHFFISLDLLLRFWQASGGLVDDEIQ